MKSTVGYDNVTLRFRLRGLLQDKRRCGMAANDWSVLCDSVVNWRMLSHFLVECEEFE